MFFSIRIFTATLGGKNFQVREQVFTNYAEKGAKKGGVENYLHYWATAKVGYNAGINRNNCYY